MTSVNEIKIGETQHMHYYDPKENDRVSLIPKQLYPVHAKKVDIRDVRVKGKYKATVYNVYYQIAEECSKHTFLTDKGEVTGAGFVGKEIRGTGVFMFLNPEPGDDFESNNGANERYLHFCEHLKIDCPEVEVELEGEKRMVKQFPTLIEKDIIGKPLLGFIDTESYINNDGETRISFKVKDFTKWEDGKFKDFELADLPF